MNAPEVLEAVQNAGGSLTIAANEFGMPCPILQLWLVTELKQHGKSWIGFLKRGGNAPTDATRRSSCCEMATEGPTHRHRPHGDRQQRGQVRSPPLCCSSEQGWKVRTLSRGIGHCASSSIVWSKSEVTKWRSKALQSFGRSDERSQVGLWARPFSARSSPALTGTVTASSRYQIGLLSITKMRRKGQNSCGSNAVPCCRWLGTALSPLIPLGDGRRKTMALPAVGIGRVDAQSDKLRPQPSVFSE